MFVLTTIFVRRYVDFVLVCFEVNYWVTSCYNVIMYWNNSSVRISQLVTTFNFLFELIMRL